MNGTIVITGTDTGIGKTVFSAALTAALGACYWKPVQSGLEDETDSRFVRRLARLPEDKVLRERYLLNTPVSPHYAARIDGVEINPQELALPALASPLIVEGAGGLLVPITETITYGDVFAQWKRPTVLCARTRLGTINHTLLSLEAMRARAIPVLGVAFIGEAMPETERIVGAMGRVKILGCLPLLAELTPEALASAFAANFRLADFEEALK